MRVQGLGFSAHVGDTTQNRIANSEPRINTFSEPVVSREVTNPPNPKP